MPSAMIPTFTHRTESGTTALTAGLAASVLACAEEIVAAIASMMWKLFTRLACTCLSSPRTPAWAVFAALIRALAVALAAGRADS